MEQLKWFERTFAYPADARRCPLLVERLAGTPARLEEKLAALAPKWLTERGGDTWTIQENVGHLADILDGAAELRPTDLLNQATSQANHNATPLPALLGQFRQLRAQTVKRLAALEASDLERSARHPRLQTPVRIPDLFLFVAEHDGHHLVRLTALLRQLA